MLSSYRLYRGNAMRELSIFVDEAGQQDMSDGYYLLTLVAHGRLLRAAFSPWPAAPVAANRGHVSDTM